MLLELYPILKDMPSAQVAIQEAARIACQKPEEMMSSPNPAGWLRKTAGLVAKNMLREQARQKRTFLPLEVLLPESEPSEWDDSDRELVQLCLDVVSEEDFTLFRRVTLDGWTYVDAAKAAGISLWACLQACGANAEKTPPRHMGHTRRFWRPVKNRMLSIYKLLKGAIEWQTKQKSEELRLSKPPEHPKAAGAAGRCAGARCRDKAYIDLVWRWS